MNKKNGIKIVLIVVSVLLVLSVIANVYLYNQQYGITPESGSEGEIIGLQNQISTLENEKVTLQNEIETLKTPNLVTRLGGNDQKPLFDTDYLHVYGSVINVGTYTANNCKIRVILYQGQTVAKDTYINLGAITGEGYVDVDEKVYYEGSELTNWSITPEWD